MKDLFWGFIVAVVASCLLVASVQGQCANGRCYPSRSAFVPTPTVRIVHAVHHTPTVHAAHAVQTIQAAPKWEWRTLASDPERRYLYRDGVQIGGFDLQSGYYRPYDRATDTWGDRCGVELIGRAAQASQVQTVASDPIPGGVKWDAIASKEEYTLAGKVVSRERAFQALGATIPDWSARLYLTVISADSAKRKQVMEDVAASPLRGRILWNDYDPGDPKESWPLDAGFGKDGFSLLLQDQKGKVLWHEQEYRGALTIEALRKADPLYDRAKDPGPHQPAPQTPSVPSGPAEIAAIPYVPKSPVLAGGLIAVAAGLGLYARRKQVDS